jgi:RNA polymerase sigma-70 factor (ECF subfamily)
MNQPQDSDESLMDQVARGKRESLERLIRRYANPLLTFIRRMIGDAHRSEEIFQEVFLAVWIKRGQYSYPRPFKPWLYGIAINKCRAVFRKQADYAPLTLVDDSATSPTAREASPLTALSPRRRPPWSQGQSLNCRPSNAPW